MKKLLALLLALLTVSGCLVFSASAEGEQTVAVEVGKVLNVGDKITSVGGSDNISVTYKLAETDVKNVFSAVGEKYADELTTGTQFRDKIAGFKTGEEYGGIYTILGQGSNVMEMLTNEGWKGASELGDSEEEEEKDEETSAEITIDYDYIKTTYYQYTTITGWKVLSVTDDSFGLTIVLEAVFTTREPTQKEKVIEAIYAKVMEIVAIILDIIGEQLIKIVPDMLSVWAKILGKA